MADKIDNEADIELAARAQAEEKFRQTLDELTGDDDFLCWLGGLAGDVAQDKVQAAKAARLGGYYKLLVLTGAVEKLPVATIKLLNDIAERVSNAQNAFIGSGGASALAAQMTDGKQGGDDDDTA